jgi:hypothetical protein
MNNVNHLIDVMVRCGALFEVWTGFLSIIQKSFGFKGLTRNTAEACIC